MFHVQGKRYVFSSYFFFTYVLANWMETSKISSPTEAISSVFHSPFGVDMPENGELNFNVSGILMRNQSADIRV